MQACAEDFFPGEHSDKHLDGDGDYIIVAMVVALNAKWSQEKNNPVEFCHLEMIRDLSFPIWHS